MAAEFLTSALLSREGFRHAFFTRRGGHSPPPFDSLHLGAVGHSPAVLAANVHACAQALGVEDDALYTVTQVHGREVVVIRGNEIRSKTLGTEADALVSAAPGVACCVKSADCVPVLIADRISGGVAAIHSGWQGTVANIVHAGVAALREELKKGGDLVAAIGPHIELCCFEVGDDIAERLQAAAPDRPVADRTYGERPHVDLRAIVREQLRALGFGDDAIDDVRGCTQCDAARFFSYRRDREKSGRLLAGIVAR